MESGPQQQVSELQYVTSHILQALNAHQESEEKWREKELERNKAAATSAAKRHEESNNREEVKIWIKKTSRCDGSAVSAMREWLMDIDLVHENFGDSRVTQTLDVATTVASGGLRREILRIMKEVPGILWKEVREKLQNRFLSINENEALRRNLEKLKQSQTESVANFCRIFRDAAEQAYPPLSRNEDQQRLILRHFLQGLKSNALAKRINNEARPKTIEEALKMVAQFEEDEDRYARLERKEEPMEIGSANTDQSSLLRKMEQLSTKIAKLEVQVEASKSANKRPGGKYEKSQGPSQKYPYESRRQGNNYSQTTQNADNRGSGRYNGNGQGRGSSTRNRPSPKWTNDGRPICLLCNQSGHMKAHCRSGQRKAGKYPGKRK